LKIVNEEPTPFEIKVEELTPSSFAEFGEILTLRETPSFDLPTKDLHRFGWQTDSETIVQIIAFKPQPLLVSVVEQHWHVTESRMHIGGPAAVIVVATPSNELPDPSMLRAFRLDRMGVMFKRGTWHGVDAYPLGGHPSEFLFLSDRATQSELFDAPVAIPTRSTIHRYAKEQCVIVKL
jgi:ureidoglycolate hydrolase